MRQCAEFSLKAEVSHVTSPHLRVFPSWAVQAQARHRSGPPARSADPPTTEDEMVGWHHQLNGHEFEQTPGDGLQSMGSKRFGRNGATEQRPQDRGAVKSGLSAVLCALL